ncbi:MAG: hypothetical protein U0324_43675 [Polyangiales bacterium]
MPTPDAPVRKHIPKSFTEPGLGPTPAPRAVTHLIALPTPAATPAPSTPTPGTVTAPQSPLDEPDLDAIVPRAPKTAALTLLAASLIASAALALDVTSRAALRRLARTPAPTIVARAPAPRPAPAGSTAPTGPAAPSPARRRAPVPPRAHVRAPGAPVATPAPLERCPSR